MIREQVHLGFFSLLDLTAGYGIARANDAFFSNGYKRFLQGKENEDTENTALWSVAVRAGLQILFSTFVGYEVRNLIHPSDQLDGFSGFLFLLGFVQQPKLIEKLDILWKEMMARLGYSTIHKPLVEQ